MPKNKTCKAPIKFDVDDGEGLDDLKRKAGVLPPKVRELLKSIGSQPITSIKIVRTPLEKATTMLLNVISMGAYEKAVRDSPYDSMFHLALFLNGAYTTDKQAVITLTKSSPIKKASEVLDVSVSKTINFNELFENGRRRMGDEKFSNYDARTNNCQDYVIGLLDGSGLLTPEARAFIKQDADVVFRKMPKIAEKIGKFITDVGAVADRVIEGEGYGIYPNGECWSVLNRGTGVVLAYCPTRDEAERQVGLLDLFKKGRSKRNPGEMQSLPRMASLEQDEGASPLRGKGTTLPMQNQKNIVEGETMQAELATPKAVQSWRQFYSERTKGKKFSGGRKEINEWMKKLSQEYKELKAKSK